MRSTRGPHSRRRRLGPRHSQRLSHRTGRREPAQATCLAVKSARARRPARRTLGATRPWTTTGYATAQWKARSARRCPPPPGPILTNRNFFSFCGGPNPCPLDQSGQAKHHHSDPRKQTSGGRHQIGTPAGFKSESVAGFLLECVAGFVGIRRAPSSPVWRHPDVGVLPVPRVLSSVRQLQCVRCEGSESVVWSRRDLCWNWLTRLRAT